MKFQTFLKFRKPIECSPFDLKSVVSKAPNSPAIFVSLARVLHVSEWPTTAVRTSHSYWRMCTSHLESDFVHSSSEPPNHKMQTLWSLLASESGEAAESVRLERISVALDHECIRKYRKFQFCVSQFEIPDRTFGPLIGLAERIERFHRRPFRWH